MTNSYIDFLNLYVTNSANQEGIFEDHTFDLNDEFKEYKKNLYVETKLYKFIKKNLITNKYNGIILTGNAGDGKTYLCKLIIEEYIGKELKSWNDQTIDLPKYNKKLHVIKDLSDYNIQKGTELFENLLNSKENEIYLIAVNEGRLRDILERIKSQNIEHKNKLIEKIEKSIQNEPDKDENSKEPDKDENIITINLNLVTTSDFVKPIMKNLSKQENWDKCNSCDKHKKCPIFFNYNKYKLELVQNRMVELYRIVEYGGEHLTFRDILIHLIFTLTAGLSCSDIDLKDENFFPYLYHYSENMWNCNNIANSQTGFTALKALTYLNPGKRSMIYIDHFIVSKFSDHEKLSIDEWYRIFGDNLCEEQLINFHDIINNYNKDINDKSDNIRSELNKVIKYGRRRIYFELDVDSSIYTTLLPLKYVTEYDKLLHNQLSSVDAKKIKNQIVRGINRYFSGFYLDIDKKLYFATKYKKSNSSLPIIEYELDKGNFIIKPEKVNSNIYDKSYGNVRFMFKIILSIQDDDGFEKTEELDKILKFNINIFIFEYLLRLANGYHHSILKDKSETFLNVLKNEVLGKYHKLLIQTKQKYNEFNYSKDIKIIYSDSEDSYKIIRLSTKSGKNVEVNLDEE